MKIAARNLAALLKKPDPTVPAYLLFGPDQLRIDHARSALTLALVGPEAETDMRISRIAAGALRKEPALLNAAQKEVGFFPGPRLVLIEGANDGLAPLIAAAVKDHADGDARILVIAGALTGKSALKKAFEDHAKAAAIAFYDDPLSREEIESALTEAGLTRLSPDAMAALTAIGASSDISGFRQLAEKLALYKLNDPEPLSVAEVELLAIPTGGEMDEALALVAEGRLPMAALALRKLATQGTGAVTLCIAAERQFRHLHRAKADPAGQGGPRPPIFGMSRDRFDRLVGLWPAAALDDVLEILVDCDLRLRSSSAAPDCALVERALLRVAAMGARRKG